MCINSSEQFTGLNRMRPVLIIVAQMLFILVNSKYYLISSRGEAGQEISGAGDDADKSKTGVVADKNKTGGVADKNKTGVKDDKNKTVADADKNRIGVESDKNKTGVKADKNKTVKDADKIKIGCDADKNKTVEPHHEAGTDYAIYDDDNGYHSSYNDYDYHYHYDYDIPIVGASKFQGVKRLM